jgi:tetratricopeptide (TPR) repeat protein
MVAKLEEARLVRSSVKDGRFDFEGEVRAYAAAFREYGIDVEALDPCEAAQRIGARAIRVELAAALDAWARQRRARPNQDGKTWRDLLAVARAADPDPWRTALRDAVLRGDRQALLDRARADEVAALPPVSRVLLAGHLAKMGGIDEATALLRRAQEQFPGDFWINHSLASYLSRMRPPRWGEAIRFYTAAVALRPDSPGARLNLGVALWRKGRLAEALAVYRCLIDRKPDYAEAHCNLGAILWEMGRRDEGVAAIRRALERKPDLAEAHSNLGRALGHRGRLDEAVAAYRRAIALRPDLADAHLHLGIAQAGRGRLAEAAAAYRRVIELKPAFAEAYCNLGVVLDHQGRLDEAVAAYRRAVERKPDLVLAHHNLGRALQRQGRLDEAVAAYRRVLDLHPDGAEAHYDLGNALREQGRLDEAVAAYRRAIARAPAYAEAHCNLGFALRQQGKFAQAVAALKRGHELGGRRADWPYPSARWVEECRRLGQLEGRLPAVLRGEAQPGSTAERTAFALLCYDRKHYVAAASLLAGALTADPKLADDLNAGCRYDAACAAALAGCGQGSDAGPLDERERARWRKQALAWLRADLAVYRKLIEGGTPPDRRLARQRLRGWQHQQDLAGLRDPAALARLPGDEREACQQLWVEVQAQFDQTGTAR